MNPQLEHTCMVAVEEKQLLEQTTRADPAPATLVQVPEVPEDPCKAPQQDTNGMAWADVNLNSSYTGTTVVLHAT